MSDLKRMTVDEYYKCELASVKREMLSTKISVIMELIKSMDNDEIYELEEEIKTYVDTIS